MATPQTDQDNRHTAATQTLRNLIIFASHGFDFPFKTETGSDVGE